MAHLLVAFSPFLLFSPSSSPPPRSPPFYEKVQCHQNLESVSVVFSHLVIFILWYTFSVKVFFSFSSRSCFQALIPFEMRPETLKIQNHDGKCGNKVWTKAQESTNNWQMKNWQWDPFLFRTSNPSKCWVLSGPARAMPPTFLCPSLTVCTLKNIISFVLELAWYITTSINSTPKGATVACTLWC